MSEENRNTPEEKGVISTDTTVSGENSPITLTLETEPAAAENIPEAQPDSESTAEPEFDEVVLEDIPFASGVSSAEEAIEAQDVNVSEVSGVDPDPIEEWYQQNNVKVHSWQMENAGSEEETAAEEAAESEPQAQEETPAEEAGSGEEVPEKTKQISTVAEIEQAREKHMTKKVEVKKVRRKKKKNQEEKLGFNWFFWISFIVIMIPVGYFLALLLSASDKTDTPLVGERPSMDIKYAIEDSAISSLKTDISAMDGVEKCEINLIVETLRININTVDTLTKEEIKALTEAVYEKVNEKLPVDTYFKIDQTYKQYDLEINAYNDLNAEMDQFIYLALSKNSNMDSYEIKDMNSPLNPELYDELMKELEEEQQEEESGETEDQSEE